MLSERFKDNDMNVFEVRPGRIEVESEFGKGSTFQMKLPLTPET